MDWSVGQTSGRIMRPMNRKLAVAACAGLALAGITGAVAAAEVTLRMKNGSFQLKGELKSYDSLKFVIYNKTFGTMTLDATRFDCEGAACPRGGQVAAPRQPPGAASVPVAAGRPGIVGIHGANTVGHELMPVLIEGYASSIRANAIKEAGPNPLEVPYKIADAGGKEMVRIDLKRHGSTTAFTSLQKRAAEIGMADRPITDQEVQQLAAAGFANMRAPQNEHVLALDGLLVIVSQDNPAVSISINDIAKIFAGQITDWNELSLPPGKINVYSVDTQAGTFSVFDALVMRPRNLTLTQAARLLASAGEVSDAVARDPNGIGVSSFAFQRNAKGVNVENSCGLIIRPSIFAVKTEEYPLTRRIFLYTTGTVSPHAKALLDYALSLEAQPLIAEAQFVDQSVQLMSFDDQGGRIAYALNAQAEDFDMAQMRQLIGQINTAQRVSITFRFKFGSSELDPKAREDVNRLVELLKTPDMREKQVMLLGFTDSIGQFASNSALSVKRAAQVRTTLLAVGKGVVTPASIASKGYSELAPVACNDSREGQNLNRRVEVWIK
ncbi:MAG: phosphate ABC transporter substrate-binding/OmpA family protein [Hyphomicrobiaceae bacterium]